MNVTNIKASRLTLRNSCNLTAFPKSYHLLYHSSPFALPPFSPCKFLSISLIICFLIVTELRLVIKVSDIKLYTCVYSEKRVLFKKNFFLMWSIFKDFVEFVYNIASILYFSSLALRHVGSLLSNQGSNPQCLHW